MCEAARHPKLPPVLVGELHRHMPPERRTAYAHVHGDIENPAANRAHELALRSRILQMQPAQDAVTRTRQIILQERPLDTGRGVAFGLKCLGEKSTLVAEYLRLDDQDIRNISLDDLHAPLAVRDICVEVY